MKKRFETTVPETVEKKILDELPGIGIYIETANDFPEMFTSWCGMPSDVIKNILDVKFSDRMKDANVISAVLAWRQNKIIYRFDDTLMEKLAVDRDIDVPVEIVQCAPYQCVYVQGKLPGMPSFLETDGAFFMLDYKHKYPERTFINVVYCFKYVDHPISVEYEWKNGEFQGNHTLKNVVSMMLDEDKCESDDIRFIEHCKRVMQRHLNMFLYLCSEKPDIERETSKPKIKGNGITRYATRADLVYVGRYIGAAFRKAEASNNSENRKSADGTRVVSPHMRRAHWHIYWTGVGKKTPVLKWLSPIFIHGQRADGTPVSLHDVEE